MKKIIGIVLGMALLGACSAPQIASPVYLAPRYK